MVKSNFSLGTVLLTIVLTIVIFIGAIAGTLIAVYKTVKVSTITGLFGDTEWISSEYDGTIEEVVKKVSDALSGEINIDTLAEISPAIGDYADLLVDNIEQNGLFKVDRERLYSTNFSQLTANLTEMLVITASLNDLSEQFSFELPDLDIITGNAESPLLVYTQVNDNEAGTIDKVFDSKYAAEPYTFYTRAESFVSEYTDDAGARQPITVKSTETLYTLEGVDTQSGYLKRSADGATLYLQTETDNDSIPFVYTPMTENNGAVYAVNGNEVTFALAANEKIMTRTGPDETDYATEDLGSAQGEVTAYEVAAPYRYTPLYSEEAQAPEGGSPMGDVPKTGDYYESNGKYYVLVTQTDGSGNYVADTENGGFAVAEGYTEETLFALEYVYTEADAAAANADTALYVETDGIGGLPVTYALTAFSRVFDMDEMTLADVGTYFGVDLSNDMLDTVRYVPMGYLSDSMGAEMNGIYVKDVLDITPDSSALLRTLAYGEEGVDYRIEGDEFVMIGNAEPKTIADLTLGLDELKISSVVDIVTDEEAEDSGGTLTASHPLMQAIADWTLTDFSDSAKINSLTIGDVITIVTDEEETDDNPASPKILQLLADVPLDEISGAIDGFTLGEMLGEEATSDGFLALLKNSTLDSLSEDLKNLTVQQMFADNIYGYHVVAQLDTTTEQATFERLQALYDQTKDAYNGLLYVYVNGKTMTFEDYRAAYKSADNQTGTITAVPSQLLSPYILVKDTGAVLDKNYSGIPLYVFDPAENDYVLATEVTGWQLPNNGEPQGATYYTDREGKNVAKAENNIYAADTLYRWDVATETMKKVSLIPAAYGLTAESQNAERLYSRLLFAEKYESGNTFEYGNLFWFDTEKEAWVQVPLQVTNGEYALAKDFDSAVIAGKNLYTYGTPVGAWKYLVTQDGKETSCPVQDIGSLMSNVQANISDLTLRDLYDDGMVDISAPDGKTPEDVLNTDISRYSIAGCNTIGDLTLNGMINLIYDIASGNINI